MADNADLPKHIGIILDGNRRWARAKGLPTLEGHRKGYENLKTIGAAAIERGIKYVSAYVFSTENWNRAQDEVDYLMNLLVWVAKHEVAEMNKQGIRVRFVGSRERLSDKVLEAIEDAEEKTNANTRGTLALCLNYGGYQELVDAFKNMMEAGIKKSEVTADVISKYLYQADIPPVDLIIRTSGEQRTSGFMLARSAYAELYFTDKFWPDFTVKDLDEALTDFAKRQRRFGQ